MYSSSSANAKELFNSKEKIIDGTHFVRDLVSEPANVLTPDYFTSLCEELKKIGVDVEVLDTKKLQQLGMNAILAVGQGSRFGTYLVCMRWNGTIKSQNHKNEPITFIGKGITFDTGGINLKTSSVSLATMKYDMGGAAVVTGLIQSLARRKAKVDVMGIIGIAENMLSNSAQRPGDIITSMSGKTIEVNNTDAEGRLLLADVIYYAQKFFQPKVIIDLATLTGGVISALGYSNAGIFSNSDSLVNKLVQAGKEVGETVWRLPLDKCYDKLIDSDIADIKNTGGGYAASSITAAQFLQRFIFNDCIWAHIDIAGVNWLSNGGDFSPKGASGYGVRLLNKFLINNYEN